LAQAIENSRNHCAFIGALQTVQAIDGVAPIVHSTAGCAVQQYFGGNKVSGWRGSGYVGGGAAPSSNVIEKQIVFGGSSRLREQIKNTVKVVKAELYTVLSGCATELVGDDIPAMVKEAQEQGFPVIYIAAPGFKGDIHNGYELAVKGIIEQLTHFSSGTRDKISGLVNVLGIIPGQDVFWQGHLLELQSILAKVGLAANTLFGLGQSIKTWQQVPQAELNLVFSPWGVKIAQYLEDKFGTPYLVVDGLPAGVDDTLQLLRKLRIRLPFADEELAAVQRLEEQRWAYYVEQIADVYYEHNLQKEVALVGETSLIPGLAGFLSASFGLIPKVLVMTDPLPESAKAAVTAKIEQLIADYATEVAFEEDQGRINDIIRRNGVELLLASSLEQKIAAELNIPLLPIAFPVTNAVILQKSYIGFKGAITLLEDLSSRIVAWREEGKDADYA